MTTLKEEISGLYQVTYSIDGEVAVLVITEQNINHTDTSEQLDKFLYLINQKSGLHLKEQDLAALQSALHLRKLACNLASIDEYYNYLTDPADEEKEFIELLNILTIKHTYFFRNTPHFDALKKIVLPEIVRQKTQSDILRPKLRIWSAGCSIGAEPYSIAMAVRDVIWNLQNWDIEILATDISTDALETARKGIYDQSLVKTVESRLLEEYFTEKKNANGSVEYEIKDVIKEMVRFNFLNLLSEGFPDDCDIIFCRNVVIYFEAETIKKIIGKFGSCISEKGYLFMGHAENLHGVTDKFVMRSSEDTIFYQKKDRNADASQKSAEKPAEKKAGRVVKLIHKFQKHNDIPDKQGTGVFAQDSEKLIQKAKQAVLRKDYTEGLFFISQIRLFDKNNTEANYLAARIYTSQRRLQDAKEQLAQVLKKDSLHVPAYYLLGSVEMELGNTESAKGNFKKAVFLDKAFPMAHFGLATLYKNSGDTKGAIREYRNALKALASACPESVLEYSGGFDAESLKTICQNNIEQMKDEQ